MNGIKLLNISEVMAITSLSLTGLKKRIKDDNFPRPVKLTLGGKTSSRSTAARFIESEVHAYLRRKVAESRYASPYAPSPLPGKQRVIDADKVLKHLIKFVNILDENNYALSLVPTRRILEEDSFLWNELKEMIFRAAPHAISAACAFGLEVEAA